MILRFTKKAFNLAQSALSILMILVAAGATETMCIGTMPYLSTAGASANLRLVLLATPHATVAIFATDCANEFVLFVLEIALGTVMSFLATDQTSDYPVLFVLKVHTFYILLVWVGCQK